MPLSIRPNYGDKPGPNKLITAVGGGPASFCTVRPQYAITYLDGCHDTVGDGASAGTRCNGAPVSVAHYDISYQQSYEKKIQPYNIDIIPFRRDSNIFAVMRVAECIDRTTVVVT